MLDARLIGFLQRHSATAHLTVSVCEGALLLAAAGLLDGYRATTHWAFRDCLARFPRIDVAPYYPRYVVDGNRITGGGISSGLDEALLNVQYNPRPPFGDGDPTVAEQPSILAPGDRLYRYGAGALHRPAARARRVIHRAGPACCQERRECSRKGRYKNSQP
jgi:hypothetical protein